MNTNMLYVKIDDVKAELQRRIDENRNYMKTETMDTDVTYRMGINTGFNTILAWLNNMETPQKSKVTDELKEEVITYMEGLYDDDCQAEDGFFLFFKRCKDAGIDYGDADAYAWLNTLIGYDIGLENAKAIDCHIFNEYNLAISELNNKDYYKNLVKSVCYDLKLELDFSKWAKEEPKHYVFFEEE